jgi:hypothetical protein
LHGLQNIHPKTPSGNKEERHFQALANVKAVIQFEEVLPSHELQEEFPRGYPRGMYQGLLVNDAIILKIVEGPPVFVGVEGVQSLQAEERNVIAL